MRQLERRHGTRRLRWCGALAVVGVLLHTASCATCSCRPAAPDEASQRASAVFAGSVVRIYEPGWWKTIRTGSDPLEITFEVERVWKGDVPSKVTLETRVATTSCGYDFDKRERYLVYAHDGQVSLCSGTRLIAEANEDLRLLGDGYPPRQATGVAQ